MAGMASELTYSISPKSIAIAPFDFKKFSTAGSSVNELALNVNIFTDNFSQAILYYFFKKIAAQN
jgi:hypothetical protein